MLVDKMLYIFGKMYAYMYIVYFFFSYIYKQQH